MLAAMGLCYADFPKCLGSKPGGGGCSLYLVREGPPVDDISACRGKQPGNDRVGTFLQHQGTAEARWLVCAPRTN